MIHKPARNWANRFPPNSAASKQVTISVSDPNKEGQNLIQKTEPPSQEEISTQIGKKRRVFQIIPSQNADPAGNIRYSSR